MVASFPGSITWENDSQNSGELYNYDHSFMIKDATQEWPVGRDAYGKVIGGRGGQAQSLHVLSSPATSQHVDAVTHLHAVQTSLAV